MSSVQSLSMCSGLPPEGVLGGQMGAPSDEGDVGEGCSVRSVSPSPVDLPGAAPDVSPAGFVLLDGDSVDGAPHHTSPLESITELEETQESPEGRSTEVGMQSYSGSPPLKLGERETMAGDALKDTGDVSHSTAGDTRDERDEMKTPSVELLKAPKGTSLNGFFRVESGEITPGVTWEGGESCSVSRTQTHLQLGGPKWTECHETRRDIPLQDPQKEMSHVFLKAMGSRERVRELSDESPGRRIEQPEGDVSDGSLIAVLTECKSKVEQLEELKCTSMDLRVQLQVAQGTAAFLQRRMLLLEEAHRLKQQEVLDLTRALHDAREALWEKSADAPSGATGGKRESGAHAEEAPANGNAAVHSPTQPRPHSRVCALL
ncbi:uncharacterized protein LOC108929768 [Scleropages formosus]|uniref:uncharacterized protein LOC108929768 n=1 Tax=Scleropages formosus TaxID=113540 RepID=UPI00087816E1|nr:uncharacterized protein LOC108929768 [Scleropages formosus]